MPRTDDTIAAISTAPGEAGIAVVRVSGPDALPIADMLFRGRGAPPSQRDPGTVLHGRLRTAADASERLDDIILLIFRAPHSYTRDDLIEIQGHGGRVTARRALQAALDAGARTAEPGEFTRRAFLNGRLDLMQAEAVADLIRARSDRAAGAALEQMDGSLSQPFNSAYDSLVALAADMEATLDFSHEELPPTVIPDLRERLAVTADMLRSLLETWHEGHLLREGALVVIAGKPNVGKSTLMNMMLRSSRAIVSEIPGTTRDTIEEVMLLAGIPLRLVDTAGLRITDCPIEQEGIARAQSYIERADVLVYLVDGSVSIDDWDRDQLARLEADKCLVLLNKQDLGCEVTESDLASEARARSCSLVHGLPAGLEDDLKTLLGDAAPIPPHAVISERHRQILVQTIESVDEAAELIAGGDDGRAVLAASALRTALETLGKATGRIYHDELLDSVFSRFCVGK
jgi:tRNA modification GTPase